MAGSPNDHYQEAQRQFVEAQERVATLQHHNHQVDELRSALNAENGRNAELLASLASEDRDVEKLESRSLKRLVAKLGGEGLEAKVERERAEAQAASDAVDLSNEQLRFLTDEIERYEGLIHDLGDTEAGVKSAQAQLESALEAAYPAIAVELAEIDRSLAEMHSGSVELREALLAGNNAVTALGELDDALQKAKTLSSADMFFSGGLLVSMIKRDRLKVSSGKSRAAAQAMAAFDRELSDTEITGATATLDSALGSEFFDVWFDNIFTDARIHNAIAAAQEQALAARAKVDEILGVVQHSYDSTMAMIGQRETEREALLGQPRDAV